MRLYVKIYCQKYQKKKREEKSSTGNEFPVTFGACKDDVHPDSHRFRRGRHQMVETLVGFHGKRQMGVGRFHVVQMVQVDFFDCLFV